MQKEKAMAAVLILKVRSKEEEKILFEVRSEYVPQPLEICFPGGHVEKGESPEHTALRECEEELGIKKETINIEGRLENASRLIGGKICPIVGNCSESALENIKVQSVEVKEVFTIPVKWLKETEFRHFSFNTAHIDDVEKREYHLPKQLKGYLKHYSFVGETDYLEYEGHGIWGLTARILKNALESGAL
ncbi:MAG: CoA pyrophosphatase [Lachnospiraceae bacterium]|nr:CoA pyrophosphatase [Lachnospiraceae bacterium]